ncbi:MAG: trimethylamine methyltransferase family protein, partial [Actinobacteria bacterium]|nr:trimethylamine methyltransferase family protein [Actinomycetota bacterium]
MYAAAKPAARGIVRCPTGGLPTCRGFTGALLSPVRPPTFSHRTAPASTLAAPRPTAAPVPRVIVPALRPIPRSRRRARPSGGLSRRIPRRQHMVDTLKLRMLSSEQVGTMREKCLELLATMGMRIDHDGALGILAEAGADVDRETHVVKFPAELVESAVKTVPGDLVVKGADPRHDLPIPHPDGLFYTSTNVQSMLHHDVESKRFEDNSVAR